MTSSSKRGDKKIRMNHLREENGVVLILAILILLVLTLIGISSLNTSSYDSAISGNKRASEEAFYIAEAGINEVKGRFKQGATGKITDENPADPDWRLFLAMNQEKAKRIGFHSGNSKHGFKESLQSQLDFGVEVRHKINSNMNVVIYGSKPVYIVKSHGFATGGGRKVIEAEIKKGLNFDPPAALYSKAPVTVKSSSTSIQGRDQCGSVDKPGIVTTLTISINGNPTIDGDPPQITNSSNILDLQKIIDNFKGYATYTYEYNADVTLTPNMPMFQGHDWGTPVYDTTKATEIPLSYGGEMNVVYFNMNQINEVILSGGFGGAGILIVEGNLRLQGGFFWYGAIIVTGSLISSGGGEKNITGAVLAGNSSYENVETDILGNTGILFCSEAISQLNDFIPFKISRWREIY